MFWKVVGLQKRLGLIMKHTDIKRRLPHNSTCVVVAKQQGPKFISYTVEIAKIGGYQKGTREHAQLLMDCGLPPRMFSSSTGNLEVDQVFLSK